MRKNIMRNVRRVSLVLTLLILYTYVVSIQNIPNNMVIFEGEKISINTLLGITLNIKNENGTIETVSNAADKTINETGRQKIAVNLFDNFEIKKLNVDVIPKTTVIPVGNIYRWSISCRNDRNTRSRQQKI